MFDPKTITYKEEYSVTCCKEKAVFETKYDSLEWLLVHIEKEHKKFYLFLEKAGRKSAQGQNGCGYFDAGEAGPKSGWARANPEFRRAHIRRALAYKIGTWT